MAGDVLSEITMQIITALNFGAQNVYRYAFSLFRVLAIIDIALFGINMAMGRKADVSSFIEKIIQIGFFIFIIFNLRPLAFDFEKSIVQVAGSVGGGFKVEIYLSNPGAVINTAHRVVLAPLSLLIEKSTGWFPRIDLQVTYLIASGLMQACFVIMAIQITVSIVEFHICLYMGMILVPFIVFEPTRFIGVKVFPAIIGAAIKLGMCSLMIGLSMSVLNMYVVMPDVDGFNVGFILKLVAVCLMLAFLSMHIPNLASSLLSGIPSLTAAGFFQNAAALGSSTMGAFRTAKSMPGKVREMKNSWKERIHKVKSGLDRAKYTANKIFRKGI